MGHFEWKILELLDEEWDPKNWSCLSRLEGLGLRVKGIGFRGLGAWGLR